MNLNKRGMAIILIPLIVIAFIYPALPEKIPLQFQSSGRVIYLGKEFLFILGILPYIIYRYLNTKKKK